MKYTLTCPCGKMLRAEERAIKGKGFYQVNYSCGDEECNFIIYKIVTDNEVEAEVRSILC